MKQPELSSADIGAIGLIMKYGKLKFTLSETAQILNRSKDGVAAYLHDHGITVERRSTKKCAGKYVHAYDIASLAADRSENVAPIRND